MSAVGENERVQQFTRRTLLLGALQLGVFGLIGGRLYQLQVRDRYKYRTLAEENRVSERLLVPTRGLIKDRSGVPLAINQPSYRLIIDPDEAGDVDLLLQKLTNFIILEAGDFKRIDRDIARGNINNGVLVTDNISWEQAATIELHHPELRGTRIELGAVRAYPYGAALAHLLGYTGTPNEKESKRDPLFMAPGFRIGKSGLEQELDEALRGTAGQQQREVDAHGKVVRELSQTPATSGQDIQLTIDVGLQQFVQQRLSKEQSAAAVIMDAQQGDIFALASTPGFDPNLFTFGIPQKDWNGLNNDPRAPLSNKVISGQYAPGSVFKIVTLLAALEAGVIQEKDTVYCSGSVEIGNHRFHCWKHGGHGRVNAISAMAGSCDTYFYDISQRVGIDAIQAMALRLGLGARTGIDLPHERPGFIPTRQWKLQTQKKEWLVGETLISAIGQGAVLTTPLQLAVMMARLVNGGIAVAPRLVRSSSPTPGSAASLRLDARHIEILRRSLSAVVNSPLGTAHAERIHEAQWAMAGKTGTSQVRRISMAERNVGVIKNDALPWEQRDHALFAGYAPLDKPRYAFAVVIEHGGSGAHAAAPLARDIMLECQKHNLADTP